MSQSVKKVLFRVNDLCEILVNLVAVCPELCVCLCTV
jgi:hypothetical protein